MSDWLIPDWPAPAGVKACVTTRAGGVSLAPFDSLNLGDHVDDSPEAVAENRRRLTDHFSIQPAWLQQVHGIAVAHADPGLVATADASWTATPGIACAAMTADCLPALFCDRAGTRVAAAHAGWRGLAAGVLEATLDSLACRRKKCWSGWVRPLARKPLKSARKCAKPSSSNCLKPPKPLCRATMLASSWPTSMSWRVCVWPLAVSPLFMVAVSAP